MRPRKISFDDLVNQNKQDLLKDQDAMVQIERKIEDKRLKSEKTQRETVKLH
ncbi:FbpB family small basic protein [Bacillaceae bacterium S4-13-56]